MTTQLKHLDEIEKEVGFPLFNLWKQGAEHHMKPCYWEHAESRHAAEYGYIIRAYLEYQEETKSSEKTGALFNKIEEERRKLK